MFKVEYLPLLLVILLSCIAPSTTVEHSVDDYKDYDEVELFRNDTIKSSKGCQDDIDCDSDKYCSDGECKPGCRPGSCSKNETCRNGKCVIGCINDEECDFNEYCDDISWKCVIGCISDETCELDEYCNEKTIKCTKGCRSDDSCELDEYCNPDTRNCTKGCRSDDNCDVTEYCNPETRQCLPGCRSDDCCEAKDYCNMKTRLCSPGCRNHTSCEDNEYCNYRKHECVDACYDESGRLKAENDTIDINNCSMYCSVKGQCLFEDDTVYCFCPWISPRLSNPFMKCHKRETARSKKISLKSAKTLMIG
ncbi:uncharacterized protein DDB_G0272530-like isoform X2 [Chironomus tepperi]|uniref:uncharacterized protein DDB_G0272530-like isoform X2 n=1 Tax=Chironomus tepperi TaxID=113505 RepID=UPI00391F292D